MINSNDAAAVKGENKNSSFTSNYGGYFLVGSSAVWMQVGINFAVPFGTGPLLKYSDTISYRTGFKYFTSYTLQ